MSEDPRIGDVEVAIVEGYHPEVALEGIDAADRAAGIVRVKLDEETEEIISAKVKDAYYGARDTGGTMHTAGDDAARAVVAALRERADVPVWYTPERAWYLLHEDGTRTEEEHFQ